jgi:hypothetical protein
LLSGNCNTPSLFYPKSNLSTNSLLLLGNRKIKMLTGNIRKFLPRNNYSSASLYICDADSGTNIYANSNLSTKSLLLLGNRCTTMRMTDDSRFILHGNCHATGSLHISNTDPYTYSSDNI